MTARHSHRICRILSRPTFQVESLEDRVSLSCVPGTIPNSAAVVRSDGVMDIANSRPVIVGASTNAGVPTNGGADLYAHDLMLWYL